MYKLERIQRRAMCVLYKLNFASIVSISALMRSLGLSVDIFVYIGYCALFIKMHLGFPEYL